MKITQIKINHSLTTRANAKRFTDEYVVLGGDVASVATFVAVKENEIVTEGGALFNTSIEPKTQGESVRGELVNLG